MACTQVGDRSSAYVLFVDPVSFVRENTTWRISIESHSRVTRQASINQYVALGFQRAHHTLRYGVFP